MPRKLLAGCLTVAALAAAQGTASASPVLTEEGSALAAKSSVAAVNDGEIEIIYGPEKYLCNSSEMAGTLSENSGKLIRWNIESGFWHGKGAGETCTVAAFSAEGLPYCFESSTLGAFVITPKQCGGEGGSWITFWLKIGELECLYRRSSISGTYKSSPEAATLSFNNEFAWAGVKGLICRTTITLKGSYQLKTPGGVNLTIG